MEINFMKKIILTLFVVNCISLGAQSKEELKKENEKLKSELQNINEKLKKQNVESGKEKKEEKSAVLITEVVKKYQTILAENNRVFFDDIFETKYKKNPQYLSTTTLGKDDDSSKFSNYNVVLANIINDASKSKEDKELALKATDFNNEYMSFFKIRQEYKDFYTKKFDSVTAVKYAANLSELNLDGFEALGKQKDDMLNSIQKYKTETCELKVNLDKLKVLAKTDNSALSSQYAQIKKNYTFPYLQKVITDMSKNWNSYNEESLPSCEQTKKNESAEKEIILEKKEEKREDKKEIVENNSKAVSQKNNPK